MDFMEPLKLRFLEVYKIFFDSRSKKIRKSLDFCGKVYYNRNICYLGNCKILSFKKLSLGSDAVLAITPDYKIT